MDTASTAPARSLRAGGPSQRASWRRRGLKNSRKGLPGKARLQFLRGDRKGRWCISQVLLPRISPFAQPPRFGNSTFRGVVELPGRGLGIWACILTSPPKWGHLSLHPPPPTSTPSANSNINALSLPGKWEEEEKSGATHTLFRTEEGSRISFWGSLGLECMDFQSTLGALKLQEHLGTLIGVSGGLPADSQRGSQPMRGSGAAPQTWIVRCPEVVVGKNHC